MLIRLDRKKVFCITYFLFCVLPACFIWFSTEDELQQWSGLDLVVYPLLASLLLYAFALLFRRFDHVLALGVIAHLVVIAAILYALFWFGPASGLSRERDLALSLSLDRPMYWISFALSLAHLMMFATTEIAVQKLSKRRA